MKFPDPPAKQNTEVVELAGISVAVLAGVILLIFVLSVVHAFVISTLWAWYIVSHFGAIPLTMPVAFGIGVMVSYLTYPIRRKKEKEEISETLAHAVLRPGLALLLGWIGTLFM